MLVEAVGDTVFFVRREHSPTELIPNVYGYGHTFPEAYTTWEADVKGSESHQRIIRYTFAGLDCLVRFEADGYHRDLVSTKAKEASGSAEDDTDLDDLLSSLGESSVSSYSSARDRPLTITHGGQPIPQSAIFDLKTRSIRKKDQDTLGNELPRFWVAQIPNFILAYHSWGLFHEIQTRDVRAEIERWEDENKDVLHQFAALLRKLVNFARGTSSGKFEIRRQEVGVLELREQCDGVGSTLPPAIEDLWILGTVQKQQPPTPDGQQTAHGGVIPGSKGEDLPNLDKEAITLAWEDGSEDFTACSTACGYCGHCAH
ncbi:hypothetical protein VTN02DRAFT_920 [Thermoascus thermophilus]